MTWLDAVILALVEGLTEFLPISSTAHLMFTETLLGVSPTDFTKMFTVSIQFGAILAVVVAYWQRFFQGFSFYKVLAFSVVPALVLGKLFDDKIEAVLEKPIPVALVLLVGGIILVYIDLIFTPKAQDTSPAVGLNQGIRIGFWQCLALMPGVSRSAASIIGGMQQGLSRQKAAEFSFFLAVPTMGAVTLYSVFLKTWNYANVPMKGYEMILSSSQNTGLFFIGNAISFLVAFLAIRSFIGFLTRYGFKIWGFYRMVVGLGLLLYFTFSPAPSKGKITTANPKQEVRV
ncbi:MAG: undecaprenyl-diphosphate phosphatase [Flavobacteriales bacterium]